MSEQHKYLLQLLSTAYEKGEKDHEMTLQELLSYLSVELKHMLENSYQKPNF